jgi:hypothetical protein
MFGFSESEWSKACQKFVEERIEAFCSFEQIDEAARQRFSKSRAKISRVTVRLPAAFRAGHVLSCVAAAEPDREKASKFQKDDIFLLLMEMGLEVLEVGCFEKIEALENAF